MPDCNIRNIDESLMRAMKAESAKQGMTLRDWAIWVFAANVGWQKQPEPVPIIERKQLSNSDALRALREAKAKLLKLTHVPKPPRPR